jgi:rubredoxin
VTEPPQQYACPNCRGNRARFALIRPMVQPVDKDPWTGEIVAVLGEPTQDVDREGRPRLSVRCRSCGFEGPESMFVAQARRQRPY